MQRWVTGAWLCRHRDRASLAAPAQFMAQGAANMGYNISANTWAQLVKHGPDTIKWALGRKGPPTRNSKVLSDIERFMAKHRSEGFASLAPQLLLLRNSKKPATSPDSVVQGHGVGSGTGGSGSIRCRSRTTISNLYGTFIDEYLTAWISLSGNAAGRNCLVAEIVKTASACADILESDAVPLTAVKQLRRLRQEEPGG